MANLNVFSRAGDDTEVPEVHTSTGSPNSRGGGIVRESNNRVRLGRNPMMMDLRKYPRNMDYLHGVATALPYAVTKEDRLSYEQVRVYWDRIFKVYDLDRAEEGAQVACINAILFDHAINGGSVLQPGRATFNIGPDKFELRHVHDILGNDRRRFFRALADDTQQVLAQIIAKYDPNDLDSKDKYDMVNEVAYKRGLQRHMDLIHDSATACTRLNSTERAAVAQSAVMIIGGTFNSADTLRADRSVITADRIDSTAVAAVPDASVTAHKRTGAVAVA